MAPLSSVAAECYTRRVRRFNLAILVALLTFSASGISAMVIGEPCTGYEQPGREDGACPPTCVTCGCCAQAVEPVFLPVTTSVENPVAVINPFSRHLPKSSPRDILHVPKPSVS
jgi:hypothetical protein